MIRNILSRINDFKEKEPSPIRFEEIPFNKMRYKHARSDNGDFMIFHASHKPITELEPSHPFHKGKKTAASRLQFVLNPIYHENHLGSDNFYVKKRRENLEDEFFYCYSATVSKDELIYNENPGFNPSINMILNESGAADDKYYDHVISVINPLLLSNFKLERKIRLIPKTNSLEYTTFIRANENIDPFLQSHYIPNDEILYGR